MPANDGADRGSDCSHLQMKPDLPADFSTFVGLLTLEKSSLIRLPPAPPKRLTLTVFTTFNNSTKV